MARTGQVLQHHNSQALRHIPRNVVQAVLRDDHVAVHEQHDLAHADHTPIASPRPMAPPARRVCLLHHEKQHALLQLEVLVLAGAGQDGLHVRARVDVVLRLLPQLARVQALEALLQAQRQCEPVVQI
jgi:hypothetical protein